MDRKVRQAVLLLCGFAVSCVGAWGQDARALVQQAVATELQADKTDQSRWRYRDDEQDKGSVSIVVQTDDGAVKRLILQNGRPLSPESARAEEGCVQAFLHDAARLAKQRRDGESDDKSAAELIAMLPDAFRWEAAGETRDEVRLVFAPNPAFRPPNMQARVLGTMSGELVVSRRDHRIKTISGRLTEDVTIGFGLLGRLKQGGTFRVERREVKPGLWQITETHVHIDGKALLFKQIGQQQDEVQTSFTQVPNGTTLEQAAELSKSLK